MAAAIDNRSYDEIYQNDMQPFIQLQSELDALMPAHVIYEQVDSKPAGFPSFGYNIFCVTNLNLMVYYFQMT